MKAKPSSSGPRPALPFNRNVGLVVAPLLHLIMTDVREHHVILKIVVRWEDSSLKFDDW
jgi:hypothetical protein